MKELNVAIFMYKVNQKTYPKSFQKPSHSYPTRFSELNYLKPIHNIKISKTQFQLEGHISAIAFLAPKRNKSLLSTNLKLQQN